MYSATAGSAFLYCRNTLERKPCSSHSEDTEHYSLQAIAFSEQPVDRSRLVACRFKDTHDDNQKKPRNGVYDILATIAEAPDNKKEKVVDDILAIKLTGSIVDLKAVSLQDEPELSYDVMPAKLIVTGCVQSVDTKKQTFQMTIYQYIDGSSVDNNLTVVGFVDTSRKFPQPFGRMPQVNSFISFSGTLKRFEQNRALVVLETITYMFPPPPNTDSPYPTTTHSSHTIVRDVKQKKIGHAKARCYPSKKRAFDQKN
ncbi:hypothetical protein EDB85DRAFT_2280280 [Lactarius pseudohatsudake]|nr:hypothetical protein EDB85DRAFT_2280280 [Lactarius pseudohatsudake]